MANRRAFLAAASALSVVGLGPNTAGAATPDAVDASELPAQTSPPWSLIAPAKGGSAIGLGWRVERLDPPTHGAATLHLRNDDGGTARVLLCRHIGAPEGVAHSLFLDIFLANDGSGRRRSDESLVRALKVLARAITASEEVERRDDAALLTLSTHAARQHLLPPSRRAQRL